MRHFWRSYTLLLRWDFLRRRRILPMIVFIQLALSVGVVYGLAFLMPDVNGKSALYLSTGAPTLSMLVLGLTVVPQEIAQNKLTGRLDWMSTLPVPRLAPLASEITYWLAASLPGTVIALVVASYRFDFGLQVNAAVVPALLLVAATSAAVGYGIAVASPPQLTQQVSSFVGIGILLFSPVNFPAEQLPAALQAVHRVLPVESMADIVRWSLTGQYVAHPATAFAVVTAWCVAAMALSVRVATRRR
ncbi:MAG: ABC transporter permease [Frankiaceae bacterium]|nr:ABC transporter permease [Frankiaceae bacterium]